MNRNRIGTKTLHNSMETRCETSCTDSSFVIVLENYSRVIPTTDGTILSHFLWAQCNRKGRNSEKTNRFILFYKWLVVSLQLETNIKKGFWNAYD